MKLRTLGVLAIAAAAPYGLPGCTQNAYVTTTPGTVSPINTATNTVGSPITVGKNPQGVATDWTGDGVWVANCASNTVSQISTATNTVAATIKLPSGSYPQGIAVTPNGGKVYVANSGYFGCSGSSQHLRYRVGHRRGDG